ncbi:MAG: hypothetical protein EZS28_011904 [Streblomastix strix]|uniref:B30.2/SPRY domain-containing protein n=1 Tax=Streblomastix strix TaxID=222440 RepID=A0A5J4WC84_9EUKA|nr:MAG: hypothetical protein EZS28_011904 [Streblomastix strix]
MEKSTYRPDETLLFGTTTGADIQTIIPRLTQDLESDVTNLHISALRQLLEIILDNRENKDLASKYKLMALLNKFVGNVEKNEEYVLSTTILHVIGVRNGSDDKMILASAATDSIILSLFSPDEKQSKSGSKSLFELIEENEIIRNSLMTTGFILKIQHSFTNNQQSSSSSSSSSSSQSEITTPYHVKCGILDVLLKLITSCDDLEPTSILIPILTEFQKNGEKEIKKKSQNILPILNSKGINSPSSESESLKEKDSKIQQLEEQKRIQETEINKLKQDNQKEKQEKEKERIENERKDSEINKLKEENKKMKEEIEKLKLKPPQVNSSVNSDFPIAIHYPDPSDIDFSDIDGKMKKITKKQNKCNTISLSQILENGIWEIETEFSGNLNGICIGVMKDSFNFSAGQHSTNCSYQCVSYSSNKYQKGQIKYKDHWTSGNKGYSAGQKVKEQFDSEKGTLIFFVDGVQEPVYISGIKEKVRFFICMYSADSSCTIRSLKKLSSPTSGHVPNEKAIQW